MTNSLYIGKLIYSLLTEDSELSSIIYQKVYPLVADNNTTFPYVVYQRNGLQNKQSTKDGYCEDSCNYTVVAVSNKYDEVIEIANHIRRILERLTIVTDDVTLYNNKLIGADEQYSDNAYIQRLNFQCTINN